MLWGVGPKTEQKLSGLGIRTIGQLAALGERDPSTGFRQAQPTSSGQALAALFGEHGREMARHALGIDERPVVNERETKSISQETTFVRDVNDDRALEATLRELASQVAKNLRRENLAGTTVRLKLRWADFTTLTRQVTLAVPSDQDGEIFEAARALLRKVRQTRAPRAPVRLLGVGVSHLGPPARQMELWGQGRASAEKTRKLQAALDALQEKYGEQVVKKGGKA
jgi:DNA polymerase-4